MKLLDEQVEITVEPAKDGKPAKMKTFTRAELVALELLEKAAGGQASTYAAKEVMDRVEGKVPFPVMGVDGAPLELTIVSNMARPKRKPPQAPAAKKDGSKVQ